MGLLGNIIVYAVGFEGGENDCTRYLRAALSSTIINLRQVSDNP
jgi:hypothetical protein